MSNLLPLLLCLVVAGAKGQEWVNDYDGYLYFECPEGQTITHLMSIHDNHYEDRIWAFDCSPLETPYDTCSWSGYVNNFDEVRF